VTEIQRFSLHDGPGLRTLIFFKGCSLSCWWCSNPESHSSHQEIMFDARKCRACGECAAACQSGALTRDAEGHFVYRQELCTLCGDCVEVCPHDIFIIQDKKIQVTGEERCVRCGRCVSHCPTRAIVTEPWAFNLLEIFEAILKTGPGIVVITDGPNGAQAADGKFHYIFPAYDVPVIATLGAGDACSSAFLAAIIKGEKVEEALELATANATCVIQKFGAKGGLLTIKEAHSFVLKKRDEEHTVRKVPFPLSRTKRKRRSARKK